MGDIAVAAGTQNNALGKIFSSFVDTVQGFYDPSLLALIKQVASSSPTPADVEIAWHLLGVWNNTGLTYPQSIPPAPPLSFPADHGFHWNMTFEWYYFALSLNLDQGERLSIIIIFFRKAIGTPQSKPKGITDLDQQIFSTSVGITFEKPGETATHYSYPVCTFAPVVGGVEYTSDPVKLTVGNNKINGSVEMFPLRLHIDGPGDSILGRPAVEINVDCAAANPLFLQGVQGYVGAGTGPAWYYYSWPNQPTTGTVTIDGKEFVANGITWMDHQWGGAPIPSPPEAPTWSGWCWCEFQFDGNRALTCFVGHGALVCGKLPGPIIGIGTFVDGKSSTLIEATLTVAEYAKSPETDANYPISWNYSITSLIPGKEIQLDIIPTTVCDQQALWQGGLNEYTEAAVNVKATGTVDGMAITMEGVGFCEGVAFEDPVETMTREKTWLYSSLQRPRAH